MNPDRTDARQAVTEALAAENSCPPSYFTDGDVHLVELRPERASDPARRRFPIGDPTIQIVSLGEGGVVSASAPWLPWVRELFEGCDRDGLFQLDRLGEVARRVAATGATLQGPLPKFLCTPEEVRDAAPPDGYAVSVTGPQGVEGLDPHDWPHALVARSRRQPHHAMTLACVAKRGDETAGVATVSAHSETLWSIGINVARGHRGRGLGVAITAALAAAVLARGRVPYYGTSSSNVPSMRTALAAGFKPGWVDVYTTRL